MGLILTILKNIDDLNVHRVHAHKVTNEKAGKIVVFICHHNLVLNLMGSFTEEKELTDLTSRGLQPCHYEEYSRFQESFRDNI